jgi:ATP/maltotriose-dependent transcriptional regulator MalT
MAEARVALEEARVLLYELGDLPMLTDNLNTSMLYYYATGDYEQARTLEAEAQRASESSGNVWARASIAISRSFLALEQGEVGRGIQIVEEALQGNKQAIVPTVLAICYLSLAALYATAGALNRAIEWCQQATALADEIMPSIRQWGFAFLAEAYFRQGDLAAGREALAQSQVGFRPDQPPGAFSPIYIPLAEARLALAEGDYGCAVTLMDVLIARLRQYGLRAWLAEALYLKGKALLEQNRLEEARATLAEGRLEAESTGSRRVLWPILVQLAQAEARRGNAGEAGDLRRQAQEIVIFMADRMGTAELRTTFMSLADARSIFEEIS